MFATDPLGEATYLGPEWADLVGSPAADGHRGGWFAHVHPDDREPVRSIFLGARRARRPFSLRCRLRRANGRHVWVVAGATPTFGAPGHDLVGFVGSLTLLATSHADDVRSYGLIGQHLPPPDEGSQTLVLLDRVADHLLIVHDLLVQGGYRKLAGPVKLALYLVGRALADRVMEAPPTDLQ